MSNSITTQVNIEMIAAKRKAEWMKLAQSDIAVHERLAMTVPWWLVVIFLGLAALSASHTIAVFLQLSPLGYAGPFVVEFGLVFVAFSRVTARQHGGRISTMLVWFERLTFAMAIAANLMGAAGRVAEQAGIQAFSIEAILGQLHALPMMTQFAIVFTPMFALFVPIGTWITGEGIAKLVVESRQKGSILEQKWRDVEQDELRRALYVAYMASGMQNQDARKLSEAIAVSIAHGRVRGLSISKPDEPKALSARIVRESVRIAPTSRNGRNADARFVVRAYLKDNPDAQNMTVRELARTLGVSKTIAAEEIVKWKQENG